MGKCKDCKYFERDTSEYSGNNYGDCNCVKFVYDGFGNDPDYNITDQLVYGDYEGYMADFQVGQDFGCIHFEGR